MFRISISFGLSLLVLLVAAPCIAEEGCAMQGWFSWTEDCEPVEGSKCVAPNYCAEQLRKETRLVCPLTGKLCESAQSPCETVLVGNITTHGGFYSSQQYSDKAFRELCQKKLKDTVTSLVGMGLPNWFDLRKRDEVEEGIRTTYESCVLATDCTNQEVEVKVCTCGGPPTPIPSLTPTAQPVGTASVFGNSRAATTSASQMPN